ncbi:MAG TPA: aminopeptidase P family N-terminal domain-containing protein, partial [Deinococcales bacterium]|nr:aminopeptidase P family N-terminal domain-containing protein [Deinococcales bacterium]
MSRMEISLDEHQGRVRRLQAALEHHGLDGFVVFGPTRVSYLSGFFYAATERPIALIVPREGEPGLLIPHLEVDHAGKQCPQVKRVRTYPEYPGGGSGRHPMLHLQDFLAELGLRGARLAADHDGYENRWGYRGPRLGQVLGQAVEERLELVDDLRTVKSEAEIALIEEAARWGDHAHRLMHDSIKEGADELEVSQAASLQATR